MVLCLKSIGSSKHSNIFYVLSYNVPKDSITLLDNPWSHYTAISERYGINFIEIN